MCVHVRTCICVHACAHVQTWIRGCAAKSQCGYLRRRMDGIRRSGVMWGPSVFHPQLLRQGSELFLIAAANMINVNIY